MLKKLSVVLCVASIFGVGLAQAATVGASGQIKFKGTVKHEPPSIVVRQGATSWGLDSGNAEIDLGGNYANLLDNGGSGGWVQALAKPFEIVILRKVPAGSGLSEGDLFNHVDTVKFTLTSETAVDGTVMTNGTAESAGGATNVGVALKYYGYSDNGTAPSTGVDVFVNDQQTSQEFSQEHIANTQHDPTFHFEAGLQKINSTGTIGSGNVTASVTVNLTYQ